MPHHKGRRIENPPLNRKRWSTQKCIQNLTALTAQLIPVLQLLSALVVAYRHAQNGLCALALATLPRR